MASSLPQAIDDDCNQTGQMLAALLDWPQVKLVYSSAVYLILYIVSSIQWLKQWRWHHTVDLQNMLVATLAQEVLVWRG